MPPGSGRAGLVSYSRVVESRGDLKVAQREPKDPISLGWIVLYPLLAVLAAMVFLSAEEMRQPNPKVGMATGPMIVDSPTWSADFGARAEALHELVMQVPLGAVVVAEERQGAGALQWTHRLLKLTIDRERRSEIESAIEAFRGLAPGVSVVSEDRFNGSEVLVGLDGLLTHTVRIYWADQPARPWVGLVVTALGDDLQLAREIIELDVPVAVSVRPFRPFSAQVAELAKIFERDVLLDWTSAGQRHGIEAALATVPGAGGVTLDGPDVDSELAAEFRSRGLFVVRSGEAIAAATVVFLPLGDGATEAFDALTRQARFGGRAIGLTGGAADRAALRQLRGFLSRWDKEEIDVVKISSFFGSPAT